MSDSYQETEQGEYEEEKDGNGRGIAQTRAELPTSSHYWTRQLMKAEEADSHRLENDYQGMEREGVC